MVTFSMAVWPGCTVPETTTADVVQPPLLTLSGSSPRLFPPTSTDPSSMATASKVATGSALDLRCGGPEGREMEGSGITRNRQPASPT